MRALHGDRQAIFEAGESFARMRPARRMFVQRCAALVLCSLAAAATCQTAGLPRIGWVVVGTPENSRPIVEAFHAGLADEGLIVGQNVVLDVRYTHGRPERYPELFADIVREPVTVLAAAGFAGISAARNASGDRIAVAGFFCGQEVETMVERLARPKGNVTGVSCLSSELAVKRVEILKSAVPALRRLGVLYNDTIPGKEKELADTRDTAATMGMSITTAGASKREQLSEAIASLRREGAEALIISEDPFTYSNRAQIVALAAEHRLVDISSFREFVMGGGVLSYGANIPERINKQARYAAKLVRGAKPSDLPIDRAVRLELVINVKAARNLGITIPDGLLVRADDVIR